MKTWWPALVPMAVILAGPVLASEDAPGLAPGTRVRLEARQATITCSSETPCPPLESGAFEAQVLEVDERAQVLKLAREARAGDASTITVRFADVHDLEVSRGTRDVRNVSKGLLGGLLVGTAAGVVFGHALASPPKNDPEGMRGAEVGGVALIGAVVGAVLGAASSSEGEHRQIWEPVHLRRPVAGLAVGPAPGRGMQAGISVAF